MSPFFTIITATYNAAGTLQRLLASLAEQTCRDFELIIQDGASTDETVAIAEAWREKLPAMSLVSEKDTGIYDAWNKGVSRARGKWVLFLGADDALYSRTILNDVHTFRLQCIEESVNCSAIDFIAGGIAVTYESGVVQRFISGNADTALEKLHKGTMPTPFPGLFIARHVLDLYKFNPVWRIAGDYDFLCATWKQQKMALTYPHIVTNMRGGGVSSLYKYAALCYKENADIANVHFGSSWTLQQKSEYIRSCIVSALYNRAPEMASKVHNFVRMVRGKPSLPENKKASSGPIFVPETTPVFIISYNRLEYLQQLIQWLEGVGQTNIIIVDNNSSYQPLLDYLHALPYRVEMLTQNYGHLVVWKCGLFTDILASQYFIVTDPDVLPVEECPTDFMCMLYNQLAANPKITKCGPCLLLDDIPGCFPLRESVVELEKRFWTVKTPDNLGYFAHIDTTFALYRPNISPENEKWYEGVRLAPPYAARHLPWYEDPTLLTAESLFYQSTTDPQSSLWSVHDAKALKLENMRLREKVTQLEGQISLLSRSWGNRFTFIAFKVLRNIKYALYKK